MNRSSQDRHCQEETIAAPHDHTSTCMEQARQIVALLPVLRRWVTDRVQRAGDAREVSLRQYAALQSIREGATTPGDLARLWQVTPAVITGIIDRLERRELVRREIDPHDRRRFQLALTDAGQTASDEIERALIGDLAHQLAAASPKELAELEGSLALLQRTFAALEAHSASEGPLCEDHDLPVWNDEEGPRALARPETSRQALAAART